MSTTVEAYCPLALYQSMRLSRRCLRFRESVLCPAHRALIDRSTDRRRLGRVGEALRSHALVATPMTYPIDRAAEQHHRHLLAIFFFAHSSTSHLNVHVTETDDVLLQHHRSFLTLDDSSWPHTSSACRLERFSTLR